MCAGKIKSESYYIARKCHWLPLHPQRPRRHYYTGQISHYKDEWVHKNTITYHSACRIPNELLTGPLIRAIGGEGTEARVPALKKSWLFHKTLYGTSFLAHMSDQACGHMLRHTGTYKRIIITHYISFITEKMHNTHRQVGPALFIQLYVEPYIIPRLDTRLLLRLSSKLRAQPGNLLYVPLTNIMPNQLALCTHKGTHSLVHMCRWHEMIILIEGA